MTCCITSYQSKFK